MSCTKYDGVAPFSNTHHAEGLVDPFLTYKKTVTGFRYPRACRIRKCQISNRLWKLPLPTYCSKRDFKN
jgi:hypothetical protein